VSFPNLSAFAVREQAITLFLILAIAVAGLFAFTRLGRAEDPSFTVKAMTWRRPGRAPLQGRWKHKSRTL
jgi:multidrug efflux pump subunit AcrB